MIQIHIERFYGNKKVTHGRLTIEGSNFTCYTLEACDPTFAPIKDKSITALPDGIYRMQFTLILTKYSLRFSCAGTHHCAKFEAGKQPSNVAPGSVILGTSFSGKFQMEGSELAMATLDKFLRHQLSCQIFNFKKLGDITCTITRSPDFTYDGKAAPQPDPTELEEEDWDLIGS